MNSKLVVLGDRFWVRIGGLQQGYQTGFKEGDRVKSETMGGSIVAVEEKPGKRILTIQYDSGRKMRIVEGNSPIERI